MSGEKRYEVGKPVRFDGASLASAACVAVFVAECALFSDFSAEDAFIVLRYARNAALNGELAFNLGERVSALTSPAHALLETALFRLVRDPLVVYKGLSFAAVLGAWIFSLRRLRGRPEGRVMMSLSAAAPAAALWTLGGLETPLLFCTVWTFATILVSSEARPSFGQFVCLHVLGGLACVIRNDAVLFVLPPIVALHLSERPHWQTGSAAIVGAVLPVTWLIFARSYFGDVLPTSAYVKAPSVGLRTAVKNAIYLVEYGLFFLVIPWLALAFRSNRSRLLVELRESPAIAGLGVGLALELVYGITAATTHMMFAARLLVPYVPAVALFAAVAAGREVAALRSLLGPKVVGALLALHAAHAVYMNERSINGLTLVGEYRHESKQDYVATFLPALVKCGLDVDRDYRERFHGGSPRPPRIAAFAAGIMPYTTKDLYVYESLVSYPLYRDHLRGFRALYGCADYVQTLTPHHGSVAQQLGEYADVGRLVSSSLIPFDGRWNRIEVYAVPLAEPRATGMTCAQSLR
jgi:hypothetical protein